MYFAREMIHALAAPQSHPLPRGEVPDSDTGGRDRQRKDNTGEIGRQIQYCLAQYNE
jgi:hypothetical protein